MNNTTKFPYVIKTDGAVTLYMKGECLTVAQDHPNYSKVVDALKNEEFDEIEDLVNIAKAVTTYANGQVRVEAGQIFYGDFAVHNTLAERIIKMMAEGFKIDHMIKFLENLMKNPSNRAVNETYTFLENHGLPITDDGCFLAYKAVKNNYTDIYSGKFRNTVGSVVSMPRNRVDETYAKDCSHGLHVGAIDYVVQYGHFVKGEAVREGGNRLLIVKVNPANVVSVPQYDSHPKMRVCEYTVVSEITDIVKELDKVVYQASSAPLDPDYNDDWNDLEETDDGLDDFPSDDVTDDQCSSACTCASKTLTEEREYNAGLDVGTADRIEGLDFYASIGEDESPSFLDGYRDGYAT